MMDTAEPREPQADRRPDPTTAEVQHAWAAWEAGVNLTPAQIAVLTWQPGTERRLAESARARMVRAGKKPVRGGLFTRNDVAEVYGLSVSGDAA